MSEDVGPLLFRGHPPETRYEREVTRLVDRDKNVPGQHVSNFRADVEAILADGEFYGVSPTEFRLLTHLQKAGVQHADNAEGGIVYLSGRQWDGFVGIRRKYIAAKRVPTNEIAHIRATRAAS